MKLCASAVLLLHLTVQLRSELERFSLLNTQSMIFQFILLLLTQQKYHLDHSQMIIMMTLKIKMEIMKIKLAKVQP
jgi:hypothetical protein